MGFTFPQGSSKPHIPISISPPNLDLSRSFHTCLFVALSLFSCHLPFLLQEANRLAEELVAEEERVKQKAEKKRLKKKVARGPGAGAQRDWGEGKLRENSRWPAGSSCQGAQGAQGR